MSAITQTDGKSLSNVILNPIPDSMFNIQSLEPQFVRVRENNVGLVYIDTADRGSLDPITNIIFGGQQNQSQVFTRKFHRIIPFFSYTFHATPNVNPRNNIISFQTNDNPAITYTAVVPEGFYGFDAPHPRPFYTAFQNALNAAGSPVAFTVAVDPTALGLRRYIITATASFRFMKNSPMMQKGRHFLNIVQDEVFTVAMTCGDVLLFYSRYLDFRSNQITQYDKLPSETTRFNGTNLVFRLFIEDPENPSYFLEPNQLSDRGINTNVDGALTAIDLKIYDEFGEEAYFPTNSLNITNGYEEKKNVDYQIEFKCQ